MQIANNERVGLSVISGQYVFLKLTFGFDTVGKEFRKEPGVGRPTSYLTTQHARGGCQKWCTCCQGDRML